MNAPTSAAPSPSGLPSGSPRGDSVPCCPGGRARCDGGTGPLFAEPDGGPKHEGKRQQQYGKDKTASSHFACQCGGQDADADENRQDRDGFKISAQRPPSLPFGAAGEPDQECRAQR